MQGLKLRKILATNVRRELRQKGITTNALADFADVSRSQLYDVLAGRKGATLDWLAKIARVLKVEPWELLAPGADRSR